MATWTYDQTKAGYLAMWKTIAIKPGRDAANCDKEARKIIAGENHYRLVEIQTGVPWFFVGALAMRESGGDFTTHLHNGDPLTARTKHVPAGRPIAPPKSGKLPYTWEESAIDALKIKGLDKVTDWSIAMMGFRAELYNGTGYTGHGVNSPYVWAGSNHEQLGKYVADHVWDKTFDDPQIGVLTVIKRLCELRADINARVNGPAAVIPADPPPAPTPIVIPKPIIVPPAAPAPIPAAPAPIPAVPAPVAEHGFWAKLWSEFKRGLKP